MYKLINCEQGSDEWFQARLGKITASVFTKIITKTGKLSSSSEEIINRAVAELITGEPDETFESDAMLRGKELEDQALEFFNFTQGYNFKKCGFMDSGRGYGCSPDGLNEEKKIGLELKCPLTHTHLAYLADEKLPRIYVQQVQGALLISKFDKWIFGSYHPSLPCFCLEIEPDETIIYPMEKLLVECCEKIQERYQKVSRLVEAS